MNFETINNAYNKVFIPDRLSIGVVVPIEQYSNSSIPTMSKHLKRVQLIENLGFKALWIRDVPFHVPSFGDAGQMYDPFTYLGYLAGQTKEIALGVSSIALPLHYPVHIAKSAASIDQLSNGRLLLGVASGDRHDEYPAMNIDYNRRDELFRESFFYIRKAQNNFPTIETNHYGTLKGDIDILPKATTSKVPMLITGNSRQTLAWNAEHSDGWMNYPRNLIEQKNIIKDWRKLVMQFSDYSKPFMQPLYIILEKDKNFKPQGIQLGIRTGINYLKEYLLNAQDAGVNHVALNLRFNTMDIEDSLALIADQILPHFHYHSTNK